MLLYRSYVAVINVFHISANIQNDPLQPNGQKILHIDGDFTIIVAGKPPNGKKPISGAVLYEQSNVPSQMLLCHPYKWRIRTHKQLLPLPTFSLLFRQKLNEETSQVFSCTRYTMLPFAAHLHPLPFCCNASQKQVEKYGKGLFKTIRDARCRSYCSPQNNCCFFQCF